MANGNITINLLDNGEFNSRETASKTVGDLRNEL